MFKSMLAMMLGLAACQSTMMNDEEAMRAHLEDARLETTRHLGAARVATTMPALRDEMTLHRDGMAPMMSDIGATMAGMRSHCDGSGLPDMDTLYGGLDSEMVQHASAMTAIDTLPAATTEVERHADVMFTMMDDMGGAMGRMECR